MATAPRPEHNETNAKSGDLQITPPFLQSFGPGALSSLALAAEHTSPQTAPSSMAHCTRSHQTSAPPATPAARDHPPAFTAPVDFPACPDAERAAEGIE